jgi:hypothetical protein
MSGAAVGLVSARYRGSPNLAPVLWFLLAAASAFLAHQPLEELLGQSPVKIRSAPEKRLALWWTAGCLTVGSFALAQMVRQGYPVILFFALASVNVFALKVVIGNARAHRFAGQIVGALGLTLTAPGAYYVVTGEIDSTSYLLWSASWLFAAAQIGYVRLRIRTANAASLRDKARAGWKVCLLHLGLPSLAAIAVIWGRIPALLALAFVPATLRCVVWAATPPRRLRVHRLGVSELVQSLVFNAFLTAALIFFH